MKKTIAFLCAFSCTSILFSQNVKLKNDNIPYKYDIYSELEGFEDHKFYHTSISDFNGNKYSYSEGNDENAKKADIFYFTSLIYGKKWNYL